MSAVHKHYSCSRVGKRNCRSNSKEWGDVHGTES